MSSDYSIPSDHSPLATLYEKYPPNCHATVAKKSAFQSKLLYYYIRDHLYDTNKLTTEGIPERRALSSRKTVSSLLNHLDETALNHGSTTISKEDVRNLELLSYKNVLLRFGGAPLLIEKFSEGIRQITHEITSHIPNDLQSMLNRVKEGYSGWKYSYFTASLKYRIFKLEATKLSWKSKRKNSSVFLENCIGIILGTESSTFRLFCEAAKKSLDFKEELCFSVLTKTRTIDLYIEGKQAFIDFVVSLSWIISINSTSPRIFPLTRGQIIVFQIRKKLNVMAKERFLSIVELFIVMYMQLALIKTCKDLLMFEEQKQLEKFIEKRFTARSIVYRLINIKSDFSKNFDNYNGESYKRYKEKARISALVRKKFQYCVGQLNQGNAQRHLGQYSKMKGYDQILKLKAVSTPNFQVLFKRYVRNQSLF